MPCANARFAVCDRKAATLRHAVTSCQDPSAIKRYRKGLDDLAARSYDQQLAISDIKSHIPEQSPGDSVNIATLLTKAAAAHSRRPAVRSSAGGLTYAELLAAAGRFASGLRNKGLVPGDRVVLSLPNCVEYPVALLGAFKAGLVVVPTNVKLHPRETQWIADNADAGAIICAPDTPLQAGVVVRQGTEWADLLESGDPATPDEEVAPDSLAWLFYTSGTTGFPKGAMLSHRSLLAMVMSCLADVCDFRSTDAVLYPAPLSHGCGLYLLPALARGADAYIYDGPRFDPDDVLGLIEREAITCVGFVAPTQIVRMLRSRVSHETSSLRCIIYGGAPIHADHAEQAVERFGNVLCQIYGQGEAPMTIASLGPAEHVSDAFTTVGYPRTDVEIRIVDGEITVRGDVVMTGYWRDLGATERALMDGWLRTGDIGTFDEKGRLMLLDRANDLIISGGSNIYPREVEDVLIQHPKVRDACVFGLPDPEWGEIVVAAVVLAEGTKVEHQELIDFCAAQLAGYKKPRQLEFVADLPKSAYGKVLRRELRQAFLADD
jgi:long-chain acyl-CoA synthetase